MVVDGEILLLGEKGWDVYYWYVDECVCEVCEVLFIGYFVDDFDIV